LQYRLAEENGVTRLKFVHRAMGLIPQEHLDGSRSVNTGWNHLMERVRKGAEQRKSATGRKVGRNRLAEHEDDNRKGE
jgi:hypothetical protein